IHWPLTTGAADNLPDRSVDIAPGTVDFNHLTLSNCTTVATVSAFSSTFGAAFGPSTNGGGTWTTPVGGPGGNLNRSIYTQLVVANTGTDSVRIDSILLNSSFYNTSSNTKLAVVYSRSGFVSDSADVGGAAFATPIALPNETNGTNANFRLAFAGGTGITIPGGGALTIR